MANRLWKEYFSFSRKERNGVMLLLLLLALFFMLPRILPPGGNTEDNRNSDSLLLDNALRLQTYKDTVYRRKKKTYPDFRAHYAERKYYPVKYPSAGSYREYRYPDNKPFPANRSRPSVAVIYLNDADTADLLPLPGIGIKLAARIISFRDRLGGFYNVQQVAETYGLPDSSFKRIEEKLQLGNKPLRLININTADLEQLRQHPYIRWHLASAIIAYRTQHGAFRELPDLLKIHLLTQETYTKISPYLTIETGEQPNAAVNDP